MTATPARPAISPVLRYKDCPRAIEFLVSAFGFAKQNVFDNPDGTVGHAELRFGPSTAGFSTAGPVSAANPWTNVRQGIYIRVDDVDRHHQRARDAGAAIVMALHDTGYGSREYSARDLAGHLWSFGTYDMGAGAEAGAQTLFPELHYPDGPAAIAWLTRAFGFEKTLEVPGTGAVVQHAELRLGGDVIMLSSAPKSDGFWGDNAQAVCVLTSDPDAHFARAKAGGASIIQPVEDTPWGSRGYFARDPEGFTWGFSNYRPATDVKRVERVIERRDTSERGR
jgi:uncharacterized glyoxalase superfamily protein PhnB